MDKLIKASDAVDIVAKHSALYGDGEVSTDDGEALLYDIMSEIMNLQSAQPQPKTGEWIFLDECSNEGVYCSKCGKKFTITKEYKLIEVTVEEVRET